MCSAWLGQAMLCWDPSVILMLGSQHEPMLEKFRRLDPSEQSCQIASESTSIFFYKLGNMKKHIKHKSLTMFSKSQHQDRVMLCLNFRPRSQHITAMLFAHHWASELQKRKSRSCSQLSSAIMAFPGVTELNNPIKVLIYARIDT